VERQQLIEMIEPLSIGAIDGFLILDQAYACGEFARDACSMRIREDGRICGSDRSLATTCRQDISKYCSKENLAGGRNASCLQQTRPFGISSARISAVGLGEERLLDPEKPDSAENRGVQIINVGKFEGNDHCSAP
jgi:hypothetical protein